jgi:CRP-like cAMP-binding protein
MHPADIAKDFQQYRFFQAFTESLLLQICTLARPVDFPKGAFILEQGKANDALYFINKGSVDVLVDNEIVTTLSAKGEVLGEMSLISQQTASASIRAKEEVQCYVINGQDFSFVAPAEKDHFQFLLFKIYSSIVTERLRATNQKARNFEIANRDLLKVQDELKKLNANLENLQRQARDRIFSRFKSLQQTNLAVLQRSIEGQDLPAAKVELAQTLKVVDDLVAHFQAEKAIESRRVLLLEPEKKQQLVAKMALGGTGVDLQILAEPEAARDLVVSHPFDLIISDVRFGALLEWINKERPQVPLVVFTSNQIQSYLEDLKRLPFVDHVVSRDVSDRALTVKTIVTTITKILNRDFFGLEKYLNWGVDVQERFVHESARRADAINEMQDALKKIGVRSSLLDRCAVVSEELLMNAIYDAPLDDKGQPLFNHLPRTEEIKLPENKAATYRYACDGNLIAVSVADPFGGLPKKIILDYLESCYLGKGGTLNEKKGGAGRGIHQIIENSDVTIFNVQKNIRTEVICLFNVDTAAKEKQKEPALHYFFL